MVVGHSQRQIEYTHDHASWQPRSSRFVMSERPDLNDRLSDVKDTPVAYCINFAIDRRYTNCCNNAGFFRMHHFAALVHALRVLVQGCRQELINT